MFNANLPLVLLLQQLLICFLLSSAPELVVTCLGSGESTVFCDLDVSRSLSLFLPLHQPPPVPLVSARVRYRAESKTTGGWQVTTGQHLWVPVSLLKTGLGRRQQAADTCQLHRASARTLTAASPVCSWTSGGGPALSSIQKVSCLQVLEEMNEFPSCSAACKREEDLLSFWQADARQRQEAAWPWWTRTEGVMAVGQAWAGLAPTGVLWRGLLMVWCCCVIWPICSLFLSVLKL